MQQYGIKNFACKPPLLTTLGSKGQKSTFSEHGHVACKIKRNDECSNMLAHLCPYKHPRPMGWGQGVKTFFLKAVMLHI